MRTAGFGTSWFRGWPSTSFILAGRPPRTFPRGAAIPLSITSRTCFSPSSQWWRRRSGRWPTVREKTTAADVEDFTKANILFRDQIWAKAAVFLIREHRPNLMLLHFLSLDSVHHGFGPGSLAATSAIAFRSEE